MVSAYLLNLQTRRQNVAQELADLDRTKVGGVPNTKSQDGGTTIDHVGYRKSLLDELKSLDDLIIKAMEVEAALDDDGPFEDHSIGYV